MRHSVSAFQKDIGRRMLEQPQEEPIERSNNSAAMTDAGPKSSGGTLLFDALAELSKDNIKYFAKDETTNGIRLHASFHSLLEHIGMAKTKVEVIQSFVHEYDFDEKTPGNGYRSFIVVMDCCIRHTLKLCRYIIENRSSMLFRKGLYMKEVGAYTAYIRKQTVCSIFQSLSCINVFYLFRRLSHASIYWPV